MTKLEINSLLTELVDNSIQFGEYLNKNNYKPLEQIRSEQGESIRKRTEIIRLITAAVMEDSNEDDRD